MLPRGHFARASTQRLGTFADGPCAINIYVALPKICLLTFHPTWPHRRCSTPARHVAREGAGKRVNNRVGQFGTFSALADYDYDVEDALAGEDFLIFNDEKGGF